MQLPIASTHPPDHGRENTLPSHSLSSFFRRSYANESDSALLMLEPDSNWCHCQVLTLVPAGYPGVSLIAHTGAAERIVLPVVPARLHPYCYDKERSLAS